MHELRQSCGNAFASRAPSLLLTLSSEDWICRWLCCAFESVHRVADRHRPKVLLVPEGKRVGRESVAIWQTPGRQAWERELASWLSRRGKRSSNVSAG